MSNKILGINVSSTIVPFGSDDNVATHEAQYGKGGYRSVERVDDLDLIKESRLEEGMLVYVKEVGKFFQYAGKEDNKRKWIEPPFSQSSRGLPVLTQKDVEELEDKVPEEYILVQDESDLIGEVTNHEVTTVNGTYLDILFRAIRKLQNEVARLKNAFELGINSYTGKETASTRILYDLEDTTEEEPLWAVQESELSLQGTLSFSDEIELDKEGVEFELDEDGLVVNISSDSASADHYAKWTPAKFDVDIENLPDPKTFLYTTTSDKSVVYGLKDDKGQIWNLSLKNILTGATYENTGSYSVLLIISKKITDPISGEEYGHNYVWIAIQDLSKDQVLFSSYIDPTTGNEYETRYDLNDKYYLEEVKLFPESKNNNTGKYEIKLSKFDLYSKYQDFSDGVDAIRPSDLDEIKYKAAHITIRSVETLEILDSILRRLQNNELVYVTSQNALYIIIEGVRHKIGGSSSPDPIIDTMTVEEILTNLAEAGVITISRTDGEEVYDNEGKVIIPTDSSGKPLDPNPIRIEFSQISKLSLINEGNGETVSYTVDSEGNLVGNIETSQKDTFQYKLENAVEFNYDGMDLSTDPENTEKNVGGKPVNSNETRGFIAKMNNFSSSTKDAGLSSDRVKIGSFYSPKDSDSVFGCSHAFIELENSSQTDYYLDGCYLHFAGPIVGTLISSGAKEIRQATYHLKLSGVIPAGGTYLIRGKKYTKEDLPTTFIKVGKPDIEWYVTKDSVDISNPTDFKAEYGKLIDLSYCGSFIYGFALTYGTPKLLYNVRIVSDTQTADDTEFISTYPYLIDSLNMFIPSAEQSLASWHPGNGKRMDTHYSNSIYKNTFELDPAKQAFQAYTTRDSSRLRGAKAPDYQIISLDKEYIQFPNSNNTCPVSVFTPKASFEGKNVCTDKTQLDANRPNMLTVSFGIDHTTTRCFNWISVGDYDEYIWIREKNSNQKWTRFQSYWGKRHEENTYGFARKEFGQEIRYNFQQDGTYDTTTINEVVYANPKYKNIFPGNHTAYKSHKCILTIPTATDNKVTYEYLAGRSNSDGTPMEGHVTEIQTFNMYPESWTPVIYQITDQQGFHWIEYQAWAAAAKVVNDKINSDIASNPTIIPVLLNTGDMTQNGTRINEWLDYYNAGYCLFDHLEQINVVGNNDLGNIDETALGTGDDPGKSNPHFYNISYCYEIPMVIDENSNNQQNEVYCPIFYEDAPKYIPSMYFIDFKDFRLYVGNSEYKITSGNNLFGLNNYNIYTGFLERIKISGTDAGTGDGNDQFATTYKSPKQMTIEVDGNYLPANHYIYETFYAWMNKNSIQTTPKKGIFACHEMPFTVITDANLRRHPISSTVTEYEHLDRSISGRGSTGLIGSHFNKLDCIKGEGFTTGFKIRNKGTYWLSRLLENFGIKYCLGGHKHTYACTWPVRENYFYRTGENSTLKSSLTNGPMTMPRSLRDDTVLFLVKINDGLPVENQSLVGSDFKNYRNLTKFPITSSNNFNGDTIKGNYGNNDAYISSITKDEFSGNANYVIYLMLQATGFKLKSNKELPGPLQKFSQIIPKTTVKASGDTPNENQIYPMFAKITLDNTNNKYDSGLDICLMAIENIVPLDTSKVFNTITVEEIKKDPDILYFDNSGGSDNENIPYGYEELYDETGTKKRPWKKPEEPEKELKLKLNF